MISTSVCIHFPDTVSVKQHLKDLDLKYQLNDDDLDVFVDDVPYEIVDGTYQDPDEQLCEHYELDYDLINCIELA